MWPLWTKLVLVALSLHTGAVLAKLSDYIDYEQLISNLTLLNDNDDDEIHERDLMLESLIGESSMNELHIWLIACGVLLFTLLISGIIIAVTILNNRGIVRNSSYDFNAKANA